MNMQGEAFKQASTRSAVCYLGDVEIEGTVCHVGLVKSLNKC